MLSEEGLLAEDWGGDIPMVEVSAKKNINLDAWLILIHFASRHDIENLDFPLHCCDLHFAPGLWIHCMACFWSPISHVIQRQTSSAYT